jgi:flagellar hook-length control protein FliK
MTAAAAAGVVTSVGTSTQGAATSATHTTTTPTTATGARTSGATTVDPPASPTDAPLTATSTGTASQTTAQGITAPIQNGTPDATANGVSSQAATATTWDALAASFGAHVISATSQTISRVAGQPTAQPRQGSGTGAVQAGAGSTARAAGAGTGTATAGVQLPGQAVAAAGSGSQTGTGTFAESFEGAVTADAGTTDTRAQAGASSTGAASTDATTADANTVALGAANASTVGQSQASGQVQASAPTTAQHITNQIADLAQAASRRLGQNVQMVLQPEGLGTVTLKVSLERGGLNVHLAVDNQQTREMVQASWPQLQQALDQRGLTVQSMLLDLSQGRGNGEAFQAFQQFNGQQSQQPQHSGSQRQGRGGSSNGDRQGGIAAIDETARASTSAGSSSRVDYRI